MRFRALDAITEVSPGAWNDLLEPDAAPFLDHGYLHALEASACVGADLKLVPKHLTLWEGPRLVAAAPAYLKTGMYNARIDWAAEVARVHGLAYYPALVLTLPRAEVTSTRFLVAPGVDRDAAIDALLAGGRELLGTSSYPSIHVAGCTKAEHDLLVRRGFIARARPSMSWGWHNQGYASFDDFLGHLNRRNRSSIRREVSILERSGAIMRTVRGAEITPDLREMMWTGHMRTLGKYGVEVSAFTHEFVRIAPDLMGDTVDLFLCERAGTPVAGCMSFGSASGLYPKFWAPPVEEVPFVYFEANMNQPIRAAIARGIPFVDAGESGEHKLSRGYVLGAPHYAPTWIGDPDLEEATRKLITKDDARLAERYAPLAVRYASLSPYRAGR